MRKHSHKVTAPLIKRMAVKLAGSICPAPKAALQKKELAANAHIARIVKISVLTSTFFIRAR
ncbi:hypothetical protein RGQ30_29060 [Limnobacter thiooxidans]|uniref:Uncharacterized protein n=1 Tax=Limnobacter thiooxidans TaxID=131080 RepID=A0AA86J9V9_9BURK|nr:hypothetical protein RGQ30_29060 [Limnobacter thiooxidans]